MKRSFTLFLVTIFFLGMIEMPLFLIKAKPEGWHCGKKLCVCESHASQNEHAQHSAPAVRKSEAPRNHDRHVGHDVVDVRQTSFLIENAPANSESHSELLRLKNKNRALALTVHSAPAIPNVFFRNSEFRIHLLLLDQRLDKPPQRASLF